MKQFPITEEDKDVKSEKTIEKKSKEKEAKTIVVPEFPTQPVKEIVNEEGDQFVLIDASTALTEILDIVRQLKKNLL